MSGSSIAIRARPRGVDLLAWHCNRGRIGTNCSTTRHHDCSGKRRWHFTMYRTMSSACCLVCTQLHDSNCRTALVVLQHIGLPVCTNASCKLSNQCHDRRWQVPTYMYLVDFATRVRDLLRLLILLCPLLMNSALNIKKLWSFIHIFFFLFD